MFTLNVAHHVHCTHVDMSCVWSCCVFANLNADTFAGVRLLVCQKNIGKSKYAFNAIQARMLPKEYKPPTSTIAEGKIAT